MGQIVRRKRRGRPSNIDRARRNSQVAPPSPVDRRSTRRRRNVRYNFDIDDYVDDDEFDDDEDADVGRREKKLRLLLFEDDSLSNRRVSHAPTSSSSSSSSSSSDDEDYNRKRSKKRKLDRKDDEDDEMEELKLDDEEENEEDEEEEEEEAGGSDFDCGTSSDIQQRVPMPDKKTLELILDKLQKKDIYGVYAEPVDPEELPDYHDVIKHPMDFATVRKKLAKGLYLSLNEFESDVFLICANAMQYNAPDTVYYKQASSIQEQAKLKFQRLRANTDLSEKELKSDHKTTPSFSLPKKQLKSMAQTEPDADLDPVETETFSDATIRTGEFPNGSSAQTPARLNSDEVLIAENSSLGDNNLDKDQELQPGRGCTSKPGRKPSIHDENRRATYNIAFEPVMDSDSVFSTFEGESKQFIPVGLHVDHSYARSLARFAATLGPVAWKIASHTIEQALPEGVKFGPGWVGEYEPLPTPVLVPGKRTLKEANFLAHFKITSDVTTDNKKASQTPKIQVDMKEVNEGFSPAILVKQEPPREPRKDLSPSPRTSFFSGSNVVHQNSQSRNFTPENMGLPPKMHVDMKEVNEGFSPAILVKQELPREPRKDPSPSPSPSTRTSFFSGSNVVHQNSQSRNFTKPESMGLPRVELNHPPPLQVNSAADFVAKRPISHASDVPSKPVSRNGNLAPFGSFKHPTSNNDGFAPGRPSKPVGLDCNRMVTMDGNMIPRQDQQGLSDPVQMMKMLAQDSKQQNPNGMGFVSKRDGSNNVALTAAQAWMSLGSATTVTGGFIKPPLLENRNIHKQQIAADSLYNPTYDRQQPQVTRFRGEFNTYQHPVRPVNDGQHQNKHAGFPQMITTTDLSRFQVQSGWRGVPPQMQQQPRPKQESRPPDLNIGYQSIGSPVRQSTGMLVDSQQPDLALQL